MVGLAHGALAHVDGEAGFTFFEVQDGLGLHCGRVDNPNATRESVLRRLGVGAKVGPLCVHVLLILCLLVNLLLFFFQLCNRLRLVVLFKYDKEVRLRVDLHLAWCISCL